MEDILEDSNSTNCTTTFESNLVIGNNVEETCETNVEIIKENVHRMEMIREEYMSKCEEDITGENENDKDTNLYENNMNETGHFERNYELLDLVTIESPEMDKCNMMEDKDGYATTSTIMEETPEAISNYNLDVEIITETTLSKHSISRQKMQEKFNETVLIPYKSSYSPLLTMKRNQKHPFEEKTPELILIEQLLHINANDKIEDTICSDVLNAQENKKEDFLSSTSSETETIAQPVATIKKISPEHKQKSAPPQKESNFVSFKESCCNIL